MKTILIVGATGLFGGHLARQLIDVGQFDVICAARNMVKLRKFCAQFGGQPLGFDRANRTELDAALKLHRPFVVIDVAGPFQDYGDDPYAFARTCILAGAHYIDIADAPEFVRGITELDLLAKLHNVTVISGASTTPALTSAVVAALSHDMAQIDVIETTILPGNKTPRGLSVMRAILGQVGQPMKLWENCAWHQTRGWSRLAHVALKVGDAELSRRPASLVNTADALLAAHFNAKTVIPRAGLELGLFHHSLRLAGFLPLKLGRVAKLAHLVAGWFAGFGSDMGGMRVQVSGGGITRCWDLIAADGHGPKIPVQPIAVMLNHLINDQAASGARPCIEELKLAELEQAMAAFGAVSEIRQVN